jgi:hypothetical protein
MKFVARFRDVVSARRVLTYYGITEVWSEGDLRYFEGGVNPKTLVGSGQFSYLNIAEDEDFERVQATESEKLEERVKRQSALMTAIKMALQ